MSICDSGMESKVFGNTIAIKIDSSHPLIKLANFIPWAKIYSLILPDLKSTTATGKWWLGRKLKVRLHLGAYILQQMFNKTDRQIEYDVKDNAAYRIFCGENIVKNWHSPDHTKIEEFRSRLSPETQRSIANEIAIAAAAAGFANFRNIDIDSTIQEANISYPTQAKMLTKIAEVASKISNYIEKNVTYFFHRLKVGNFFVDLKEIKSHYKSCIFGNKNDDEIKSKNKLLNLLKAVSSPICAANSTCKKMLRWLPALPWNIKRAVDQIINIGWPYVMDLSSNLYLSRNFQLPFSLHAQEVGCFNKGKPHKKYEFGRAYQLIRSEGNFVVVLPNTDLRMHDKSAIDKVINEHSNLFGDKNIDSSTADKGYYSSNNEDKLISAGATLIGIARPVKVKKENLHEQSIIEKLQNRRSGIEPIIGHIKHKGQLGRSRMKSDRATLSSGYSSVLGFNLRQIVRYQGNNVQNIVKTNAI